jgi:hypothetical protein
VQDWSKSSRLGWAHHPPDELHHEPTDTETSGGNHRVDQDGGRTAAKPVSGIGTDAGLGLLRRGDLQPAATGATGGGGMKRRREPGQKPGADGERNLREPREGWPVPVEAAATTLPTLHFEN